MLDAEKHIQQRWFKPCMIALSPIVLSLLLQLPIMLINSSPYYDEATYLDISRNILRWGLPYRSSNELPGTLYFFHPPFGRYLTAAGLFLFGDTLAVARTLSSFASILLIFLFFRFLRKETNALVASVFSTILATQSLFLVYAHSAYVEMPLTLLCFSGYLAILRAQPSITRNQADMWTIIASVLFGVATLFKYHAVLYFLPIAVYVGLRHLEFRRALLLLLMPTTFLSLWLLAAWNLDPAIFRRDILWTIHQTLGQGEYRSPLIPWRFFVFKEFLPALGPTLFLAVPVLFILLGLRKTQTIMSRNAPSLVALLVLAASFTATLAISYKQTRYIVPALPLLIFLVGQLTYAKAKTFEDCKTGNRFCIAVATAILITASPALDLCLGLSGTVFGRPRQFRGIYSESLNHAKHYAGLDRVAAKLREIGTLDYDLILGPGEITNLLTYYARARFCEGEKCQKATFLVFNPNKPDHMAFVRSHRPHITDFHLVARFANMGPWIGPLELWKRK